MFKIIKINNIQVFCPQYYFLLKLNMLEDHNYEYFIEVVS